MATYYDPAKQKLQALYRDDSTPAELGMSPPAPGAAAPQDPAKPFAGGATGAGWVNLQDYLGVAKDQGREMAGGLANRTAQGGATFNKGLKAAQTQFGQSLNEDEIAGRDVRTNSMAAQSGFGQLASNGVRAEQNANALVDFSGRQPLLQDLYGKGENYTAGMGRFDSFLSGAAGGDLYKEVQDQYGGLSKALGAANDASAAQANDARGRIVGRASRDTASPYDAFRGDDELFKEADRLAGVFNHPWDQDSLKTVMDKRLGAGTYERWTARRDMTTSHGGA